MKKTAENKDTLIYERGLLAKGFSRVCGVDEVGRGPLCGPVVVASVILPLDKDSIIEGVDDSKKLTKLRRERLFDEITERAVGFYVASVSPDVIDEINILNATKRAMRESIENLSPTPDFALVDAVKLDGLRCDFEAVIKGDAKSYLIAAASIVAKVSRDRLMSEYDKLYPGYGFANNSGYGTAEHISALKRLGATPIHRKTFIKRFVGER